MFGDYLRKLLAPKRHSVELPTDCRSVVATCSANFHAPLAEQRFEAQQHSKRRQKFGLKLGDQLVPVILKISR
jgi:hypothetical protein